MTEKLAKMGIKERLAFLLKDSFVYGAAASINRATALITFPIIARYLSVEDFGAIDSFILLVAVFVNTVTFGMDSSVARFFFEVDKAEEKKQVVSQALAFQVLCLIICTPILIISSNLISSWFGARVVQLGNCMTIVAMQVPFAVANNAFRGLLKWTFARNQFVFLSVGTAVFNCVGVLLVVSLGLGSVATFLYVQLFSAIIFFPVGLYFVRKWIVWPSSFKYLPAMMKFAAPYGVICALLVYIPATERSMVANLLGEFEQGLFAAAAKLGAFLALPINAFQVAWGPFSLSTFKEPNAVKTYNWVLKCFAIGIFTLSMVIHAFGEILISVLASPVYAKGSLAVFAICMVLAVRSVGWITEVGIDFSKKSYLKLFSNISAFALTLLAIYFLTIRFGLAGVAWGTLAGCIYKTFVETSLAQRAHPMKWEFKGVVWLGVLTLVLGAIAQAVLIFCGPQWNLGLSLIFTMMILVFGWFGVFKKSERNRIIQRIRMGRFVAAKSIG